MTLVCRPAHKENDGAARCGLPADIARDAKGGYL